MIRFGSMDTFHLSGPINVPESVKPLSPLCPWTLNIGYRLNIVDVKLQIDGGHASLHGQASRTMRLIGGGDGRTSAKRLRVMGSPGPFW
ncbi:hypothetical protein BDW42DRAFT_160834 [Aspergillus taichungensis]|uniref:Uncharacterized protein n=1 Tax=Aspergillus taichungensis TaxID=482145 RepID=A0A2J5I5V5_9EURO|nr:hypothetical protein BDW42DRAFT_160834 [Aspergillus taichungensis]